MARADSTIRVLILGDAKGLQGELRAADKGVKGFGASWKGLVGGIAAGVVASEVIDFAQTAIGEADRLGDATQRLELQLGDLSGPLVAAADGYSRLGLSAQDMLELEAATADVATALGVADPLIASFADEAAATAGAIALMGDDDAATVIDQIGKAAGGSEKALKALGINLTDAEVVARALRDTGKGTADALTDGEKAAAAYALVLEKLAPKLDAATNASGDLEQSQRELEAKWETLTGKIGDAIDGPLAALLDWIIRGIEGWEQFAAILPAVGAEIEKLLEPIAAVTDAIGGLLGLIDKLAPWNLAGTIHGAVDDITGGGLSGGGRTAPFVPQSVNVNVNGGDPAEVERAVKKAIGGYNDRNGQLITG